MKKTHPLFRFLCVFFAVQLAVPFPLWAQLTVSVPTFPTTNTVHLTLNGADTNNAHIIFFTPDVSASLAGWTRMTTGTVGQTTFDLTKPTNSNAFFAAGVAPISTPTVATPVFNPPGGSYGTATNVIITSDTVGAAIYYTTNGSTPTPSDNYIVNGGSVYVSSVTTFKAKAFASGYNDSGVATNTYIINAAPFVTAGAQQIISSSPTTLAGFVSDDGLTGGGTKFTNWTQISGPATVVFTNSHQTNTTASLSANGIYVLQLSASDGQYTNSSQVTIARNPTITVSLTDPADGSTYTVPTNIFLQATASTTSGSITQVLFYANSTLIGTATNSPYSLNWKSVPAGNLSLTAVAVSDDINNHALASTPVNITVAWPTNVGQVTFALNDLQIPAAGLPITVNREYNTQYGTSGSFGYNGRLDYDAIKIEKSASLSGGYTALISLGENYIIPNHNTLVTVTLGAGEKYAFVPKILFNDLNHTNHTGGSTVFDVPITFVFDAAGSNAKLGSINAPSDVGMVGDEYYANSHWQGDIFAGYPDTDGEPMGAYEPDFTQFNFTAPDGTKYTFNSDGTVATKTDRKGNSLTYSSGGITYLSGKQITFIRDGNNRIMEIYDPIALATSGSPALKYAYDANGNLTNSARLIQRSPAVYENTGYAFTNTTFIYNVTAVTDPRGIVSSRYEYDSAGRLTMQYDALGRYTSYIYDTANHRQVLTDKLNHSTTQLFTPSGQLASVQDAAGGLTTYGYDSQGRKTGETNTLNQPTTYAYDSSDNLIGVTNEIGNSSSATYNSYGQPLITVDARNFGTTNGYDASGNLIAVTNALAIVSRYGYDTQGNRVAETNAFGLSEQSVVLNSYNEFGWLTNSTTALNAVSYTYDDNGNRLTETKTRTAGNILTQWRYDAANRRIITIDAGNNTNFVSYNGIGKQSQTVDALNRTNKFFYDSVGLLTNTTYADGLFESYGYDAEGHRTTSTDRGLHTTTYSYDTLGRLTRTTFADDNYASSGYDAGGRLIRSIQGSTTPNGMSPPTVIELTTRYFYDAAGRRTSITNALNQGTRFVYDANGNQTNVIDSLGRTNVYVFDALNRQSKIIYPDTAAETYGYDGLDRKVAMTNQASIVTRYGYDILGRLVAVTNAFGATEQMVTRYTYDEVGNMLQQIDALNRTNIFTYDALGRRTKETLPGTQAQTFGYDAIGNLTRLTNFNSVIITNQYDALNRITNKASVNGYKISYAYSTTSQRTNMVDASGTNSYTYDTRDRLLTKATPQGTLTYTYDGFGNVVTVQSSTANGTSLTYGYDLLNRLTNVIDRFNNSTTYAFDGVGNLQTMLYPNTATNSYAYDALNRLTNITSKSSGGTLATFAYRLASAGNRTNMTETVNSANRTNVWNYDPLYRLTNETIVAAIGGTISYKYDGVGNRTNRTSTVTGVVGATNSFNSNDQLTSDTYDSNGNTKTNGSNAFFYDVENRLTNAIVGGTNIVIVYDGDGNRVKKIVGTTTNIYLVDDRNPTGYAQVLEDKSSTTNLYTYGLDLISQRQGDTTTSFYGYDGNGNVRFLTVANGTVSDTYIYDAFGVQIASTGTTPNNYRYSGEQSDPNLGFIYLRARYMNPNTGRFWSRDSFAGRTFDPATLHRYTYTANNPVNRLDPSGNETLGGLLLNFSIRAYLFAQSYAPTINAVRIALTGLTLGLFAADSAGLLTSDQSLVGIYLSSGGNPFAEAQYVIGEIRTLRTALIAARTVSAVGTLTAEELAVVNEARQILSSGELARIRAAQKAGDTVRAVINGRTIQYQPGLPFSGFTWFEQKGFVLSDSAFASDAELTKTILHELRRLSTSSLTTGSAISGSAAANETLDAYQFAERAYVEQFQR